MSQLLHLSPQCAQALSQAHQYCRLLRTNLGNCDVTFSECLHKYFRGSQSITHGVTISLD